MPANQPPTNTSTLAGCPEDMARGVRIYCAAIRLFPPNKVDSSCGDFNSPTRQSWQLDCLDLFAWLFPRVIKCQKVEQNRFIPHVAVSCCVVVVRPPFCARRRCQATISFPAQRSVHHGARRLTKLDTSISAITWRQRGPGRQGHIAFSSDHCDWAVLRKKRSPMGWTRN